MTVRELIERLQRLPQDLPVYHTGRDNEEEPIEGHELLEAVDYHPTWHAPYPRRVILTYWETK